MKKEAEKVLGYQALSYPSMWFKGKLAIIVECFVFIDVHV